MFGSKRIKLDKALVQVVLEFSRVSKPLAPLYDLYSFQVLPRMGQAVVGDGDSYRYLAESIRMHPDQETLKQMMEAAVLERVDYVNLTAGVGYALLGDYWKSAPIAGGGGHLPDHPLAFVVAFTTRF